MNAGRRRIQHRDLAAAQMPAVLLAPRFRSNRIEAVARVLFIMRE